MPADLQLDHLRCPLAGCELHWMAGDQLQKLREAVADALIVSRGGDLVTQVPEAALVSAEARLAYPVVHGIPALVPSEAIELGQLGELLKDTDEN